MECRFPRSVSAAAFTDRPDIMFDFAIAQQQKHLPSRRWIASWIVSCLGHAGLVLVLYQYPQLLRSGVNSWLQVSGVFSSPAPAKKEYRNVIVLGSKMEMPPAEELRKYLYDWDRARKLQEMPSRPVVVQLPRALVEDLSAPLPKPPQDPPTAAKTQPAVPPAPATAADPSVAAAAGQLPAITEPKQIPKGITAAQPPGSAAAASVPTNTAASGPTRPPAAGASESRPADQQTGVRLQGDVLFDTRGFNLDEYARIVKDRCEEHWMIPSNLRTFQGSVIIVFYITKQGQVTQAKIEVPSGNDSLNISALSAVWESSPFPPLPRGFPAERVGARLVFAYNER